jgi:hypothetical protein
MRYLKKTETGSIIFHTLHNENRKVYKSVLQMCLISHSFFF